MRAVKIGVSACLLGENVRYNGGNKHEPYITGTLAGFFTLVPVCPEVESGMTVPREPMHLEGEIGHPRLVTNQSRRELTGQMASFCSKRMMELEAEGLSGFILKSNSPSCGLSGVKVFSDGERGSGSGLFAAVLLRHFPGMPVEEEGGLADTAMRQNFIERILGYSRLQAFLSQKPDLGALVAFHSRHKLVMMAHSVVMYREIGTLVAGGKEMDLQELLRRYRDLFMKALAEHATVEKHTNVLQHVMGYFKKDLGSFEKEELAAAIARYRDKELPLLVPLTLLRHYSDKFDQHYLQQQLYLFPDPAELMLENHA